MSYSNSESLKLGFTVEIPEEFYKCTDVWSLSTQSDLIGLEFSLGIRGIKNSPGDFFFKCSKV